MFIVGSIETKKMSKEKRRKKYLRKVKNRSWLRKNARILEKQRMPLKSHIIYLQQVTNANIARPTVRNSLGQCRSSF